MRVQDVREIWRSKKLAEVHSRAGFFLEYTEVDIVADKNLVGLAVCTEIIRDCALPKTPCGRTWSCYVGVYLSSNVFGKSWGILGYERVGLVEITATWTTCAQWL